MNEVEVQQAAKRLIGNRDYKLVIEYLTEMFANLVLSSDPAEQQSLVTAMHEYRAAKELEAQVAFLADRVRHGG